MSRLPPDFLASILLALHLAPDQPSLLPELLGRSGPLPASHAQAGEMARPGHISVARVEPLTQDARRTRQSEGP